MFKNSLESSWRRWWSSHYTQCLPEIRTSCLIYAHLLFLKQLHTNSQTSATTTSRVAKSSSVSTSSQRLHVTTSSTSDSKVTSVKSDLDELKSNFKEMKSLRFNSLETLVDNDDMTGDGSAQPLVTFPDDTPVPSEMSSPTNLMDTVKYEQKTVNNFKTSKVSCV